MNSCFTGVGSEGDAVSRHWRTSWWLAPNPQGEFGNAAIASHQSVTNCCGASVCRSNDYLMIDLVIDLMINLIVDLFTYLVIDLMIDLMICLTGYLMTDLITYPMIDLMIYLIEFRRWGRGSKNRSMIDDY